MRTIYLLAFLGLVSGGCIVVHDNGGGGGAGGGGGGGGSGGPPVYRILPGAGTVVAVGSQPGYGITANTGGSYRAVWTGSSAQSYTHFTGTIYTPGSFTAFQPGCGGYCPDESSDIIYQPAPVAGGGSQISFDTYALDGLDGLDFGVSLEPVEFTLLIEGAAYPSLVFFTSGDTGQTASPGAMPFDLTTN
jgi:hypothetical protein